MGSLFSQVFLLQTDQIHCYSQDGGLVPCDGSGQDADCGKKTGLFAPGRFQVSNQVVRDQWTGAVWSRNANPVEFPMTWQEALDFIDRMRADRLYGLSDWQLPSRRLLFALLSHQHINPALPPNHPFDDVFPGYYWCRESCRRLDDQAWYVHLGGGRVHRGMKHGSYMVWPVSPGRAAHLPEAAAGAGRFAVQGECVHDRLTGLTWSKDADPAGALNWAQALSAVAVFNRRTMAGYSDWRLPNIRELESLVSLGAHSPALSAGHPFDRVRGEYWSSTTSAYEPRYAWALYSRDGIVGVGFKPSAEFHLWPVRGRR